MQADPQARASQKADLEMRLQVVNTAIEDLERQVQAAAPRYNQLVDAPVSSKEVLGCLRQSEALVQILIGTKSSFGFLMDANGVTPYEIDITEPQVINAARIESKHPVSYADAFVAALAQKLNATIVTGDPEFKKFEFSGSILWL